MNYTKAQRMAIAAAFRAAKKKLWDGEPISDGLSTICFALVSCGHASGHLARGVVESRLAPSNSVRWWLQEQGVPTYSLTERRLQQHRHAWLDMLIEEFEA